MGYWQGLAECARLAGFLKFIKEGNFKSCCVVIESYNSSSIPGFWQGVERKSGEEGIVRSRSCVQYSSWFLRWFASF